MLESDTLEHKWRPASPALSSPSELSEIQSPEATSQKRPSDSSLLLKVTIRDGTLLAGRPTYAKEAAKFGKSSRRSRQNCAFAVVQVLSNALIMFQSVENPDASGTTTLHISLDDLSASVNTAFVRIPTAELAPMIGPTGVEFRIANGTENLGNIVSHDVSVDCENLKSSLTPNDLSILVSIVSTMSRRLQGVQVGGDMPEENLSATKSWKTSSITRYRKRGTGIVTNIRVELHAFSFVVLRDFKTKYGAPEFLALNLIGMKVRLGGCLSALSGECSATISVDFFNAEVSDWEYAVEPFPMIISIDQMPNELVCTCLVCKFDL